MLLTFLYAIPLTLLSFAQIATANPIINETYTGLVDVSNGQWIPIQQPATGVEKRGAEFHAYTQTNTCTGNYFIWPNLGAGCVEYWENGQRRAMRSLWVSKRNCGVKMYLSSGCPGTPYAGPVNSQGCIYFPATIGGGYLEFWSYSMNCP